MAKNEDSKKEVAPVKDAAQVDAGPEVDTPASSEFEVQEEAPKAEQKFKLTIHSESSPGGSDAVFVGVNGRQFQIRRDTEVTVPKGVISVLNDAVKSLPIMDKEGNITGWRQAKAYSYSVEPA